MNTQPFTADCGHLIPPRNDWAAGYAVIHALGYMPHKRAGFTGKNGEAQVCYACAAEIEQRCMIDIGRATLYLVRRTPSPHQWHITDWSGTLDFPAFNMTRSLGRAFCSDYQITTGRFRGPDGKLWAFRNAGDNQIARCRRLKDARA